MDTLPLSRSVGSVAPLPRASAVRVLGEQGKGKGRIKEGRGVRLVDLPFLVNRAQPRPRSECRCIVGNGQLIRTEGGVHGEGCPVLFSPKSSPRPRAGTSGGKPGALSELEQDSRVAELTSSSPSSPTTLPTPPIQRFAHPPNKAEKVEKAKSPRPSNLRPAI